MHLDKPFPLNAVPSRVRKAILEEFKGRCPSIREVAAIPDRYWLSTPTIGPALLEKIRRVSGPQLPQVARPSSARSGDAELLERLEWLREELRKTQEQLKACLSQARSGRPISGSRPECPPSTSGLA